MYLQFSVSRIFSTEMKRKTDERWNRAVVTCVVVRLAFASLEIGYFACNSNGDRLRRNRSFPLSSKGDSTRNHNFHRNTLKIGITERNYNNIYNNSRDNIYT